MPGIVKIIESLKISSHGIGNIKLKFLKNAKICSSVILSKLLKQSLTSGNLPNDREIGKVVPIHKSGYKSSADNYRPISITSICCKAMEHIIFKYLIEHLDSRFF